ncbi:MAG: hypothetical protein JRE40_00295 [Deltaproteobacteria bacterium]|nr:hypothetical protein [Deltaproteobacteria bacterium]
MAKTKRLRQPQVELSSGIYRSGSEMYTRMLSEVMQEGIDGKGAVQYGANRWQFNFTGMVDDISGPLPNVNDFTYPKNRWRKYLQDYVGPEGINGLRNAMRMGLAGQGDAFWPTTVRVHHQGMRAHNEKGNCFVGVSFRSNPRPSITMISRTVTLTPMGLLDVSFGVLLARIYAKVIGGSTPPVFSWQVPSICVTPSHSTILVLKKGWADDMIKHDLVNGNGEEVFTKRTEKDFIKYGNHWPGKHYLEFPDDFDNYPQMVKSTFKMTSQFMEEDDREFGQGYAQYKRMQRKLRLFLHDQERIQPWKPILPEEWFSDMFHLGKKWAKNHTDEPTPQLSLTMDDFPRGIDLTPYEDYDKATSVPDLLEYIYGGM